MTSNDKKKIIRKVFRNVVESFGETNFRFLEILLLNKLRFFLLCADFKCCIFNRFV